MAVDRILTATERVNGVALITADHGNAELMFDEKTSQYTAHTTNPVPLILFDAQKRFGALRGGGVLSNVAPTILTILGIEKPAEMTADRPFMSRQPHPRTSRTDRGQRRRHRAGMGTTVRCPTSGRRRCLAERLASLQPTALCSSPLGRAMATAEAIAAATGLPITQLPELREMNYGGWEGRSAFDVRREADLPTLDRGRGRPAPTANRMPMCGASCERSAKSTASGRSSSPMAPRSARRHCITGTAHPDRPPLRAGQRCAQRLCLAHRSLGLESLPEIKHDHSKASSTNSPKL